MQRRAVGWVLATVLPLVTVPLPLFAQEIAAQEPAAQEAAAPHRFANPERADQKSARAAHWVKVPAQNGSPELTLRGWWSPAASTGSRPAVLMLHGCGGMVNKQGQPTARMREYARLLNEQGWHALALDSLTPRGETEICTQRAGTRKVTMTERRQDAWAGLRWLANQPGVDGQRMALLGWSNGGSAVLAATAEQNAAVRSLHQASDAPPLPKLAVAFYPGCEVESRRGYQPLVPLVLMLGMADDWTPPQFCLDLARKQPQVVVHSWAGAFHGFDSDAPVRVRTDVPNGVNPGQGVHVGGQVQAKDESRQLLVRHLRMAFTAP